MFVNDSIALAITDRDDHEPFSVVESNSLATDQVQVIKSLTASALFPDSTSICITNALYKLKVLMDCHVTREHQIHVQTVQYWEHQIKLMRLPRNPEIDIQS